jgi:hypothetical protein
MDWPELVSGGKVPVVREVRNGPPDVVESGRPGRRLADNPRFLIASAVMALGAGLVLAILAAAHYHAQANGLQRQLRSPRSPPASSAAAMPRVSTSTAAIPESGAIRGEVAIVMVDHMPGGNAELLIMAYISGGTPRTRYALMGRNCLSNSADHLWASGVTNNQGIAVLTGRPWTSNASDYYWTWTQPPPGRTPPPARYGPTAADQATALQADQVLCAPHQLHGRFKIIS